MTNLKAIRAGVAPDCYGFIQIDAEQAMPFGNTEGGNDGCLLVASVVQIKHFLSVFNMRMVHSMVHSMCMVSIMRTVGTKLYTSPPPLAEPAVEPAAVRYDFDGYGWKYIDNGSGSDWLERGMNWKDHELVYTSLLPPAEVPLLTNDEIEREWQFLHDEEGNPPDQHDFARAIEQAALQKAGLQ